MMSTASIQPKAVSQDLLDRSGRGLLTDTPSLYLDCFHLPMTICTFEGKNHIDNHDDLMAIFSATRAYLIRAGVTDLVRHCLHAAFSGPDTIKATHESRYLSGSRLHLRPVVAFSVLRRIDGLWGVSDSQYAISDSPALAAAVSLQSKKNQSDR